MVGKETEEERGAKEGPFIFFFFFGLHRSDSIVEAVGFAAVTKLEGTRPAWCYIPLVPTAVHT